MTKANPLADLDLRQRQLETHLLRSHDYRDKATWRLRLLTLILVMALLFAVGEAVAYEREGSPESPLVLGSIRVTSLVLVISVLLLFQTRRCLRRLNKRWLTPEAKEALDTLRREQMTTQVDGARRA